MGIRSYVNGRASWLRRLGLRRLRSLVPMIVVAAAASAVGQPGIFSPPAEGQRPELPVVPTDPYDSPASVKVPDDIQASDGESSDTSDDGIPQTALAAYQRAASVLADADPSCGLDWSLIAAIGKVESDHGRYGGSALDSDGVARPEIIGVPLTGANNTARIPDSDGGDLDGDTEWDRAVGPMQFIPSTWRNVAVDGDGDGRKDPHDIDDAAIATGVYLCAGDHDLSSEAGARQAVYRYNHSWDYVDLVIVLAEAYANGDYSAVPDGTPTLTSGPDDTTTQQGPFGDPDGDNEPPSNAPPDDQNGPDNDGSPPIDNDGNPDDDTTNVPPTETVDENPDGEQDPDGDPDGETATVPSQPRGVNADGGNGLAKVHWTRPARNGGAPTTGYTIYVYKGAADQPFDSAAAPADATSRTIPDLTNGQPYTFKVAAKNRKGTGPRSGRSDPVTPATTPGAPTVDTVEAGDQSVTVSWTKPANNGGAPITGYTIHIYEVHDGQATETMEPVNVGANTTSHTVEGLANGTTYRFTVVAHNAEGPSPTSDGSGEVTPATSPAKPTVDTVKAGDQSATVSWTKPASNGSPITGYTIDVYNADTGTLVKSVPVDNPDATSITVEGLANDTDYRFTVVAHNKKGSTASDKTSTVTPQASGDEAARREE